MPPESRRRQQAAAASLRNQPQTSNNEHTTYHPSGRRARVARRIHRMLLLRPRRMPRRMLRGRRRRGARDARRDCGHGRLARHGVGQPVGRGAGSDRPAGGGLHRPRRRARDEHCGRARLRVHLPRGRLLPVRARTGLPGGADRLLQTHKLRALPAAREDVCRRAGGPELQPVGNMPAGRGERARAPSAALQVSGGAAQEAPGNPPAPSPAATTTGRWWRPATC